jgi:hypothetical protein
MTWFDVLTGFPEVSPRLVRQNMMVTGDTLTSRVNRKVYTCGRLETPSLGELRTRVGASCQARGKLSVREVVADVFHLHAQPSNAGCLFQVASQSNLLEMVSPEVTPEQGVGIYEHDLTQGPRCAIAAGAGTIYRNYFVPVAGQVGQSASCQIDCLADLGRAFGNSEQRLWEMKNGYALASRDGLIEISRRLNASSEHDRDQLRQLLRIGLQWHTQVTIDNSQHTVSQAYCSALPVAYSPHAADLWEAFARLVLEAAYEATLCSAILNSLSTGNRCVFLTLLGGGAFGNKTEWITASLERALQLYAHWDLDVAIVSYGASKPFIRQLLSQFSRSA